MTVNRPLLTLISVFFFWGFVAAGNDILIPVFKDKLHLEHWQSQMISFAFYVAYTVGSIIYLLVSNVLGKDLLSKIGSKNGISVGLLISALGTLLFYPAAELESFGIMITGLFVVGLGFSLQQTAANPLAIRMGDPAKGSQRLSLAGGINNVGSMLGPILISLAIFGAVGGGATSLAGIDSVKVPYLILGAAFVLVAIIFRFSNIPDQVEDNTVKASAGATIADRGSVLKYPQLVFGMIAIFVYVGVEVSTAGNLSEFIKQKTSIKTEGVGPYIALFWASLMVGRWTSSVGTFPMGKSMKQVMNFLVPYIAFAFFLVVTSIAGHNVESLYVYAAVIPVLIICDILSKGNPARQLLIFSFAGIVALIIGIFASGMVAVYALVSVGLFCSTLWPCIFTLAIGGLGKYTNKGSGLLIMMIMGGGIISVLQGVLAEDYLLGIQHSYWVGVACFIYLAWYAMKAKRELILQGIDFDKKTGPAH
jgi:FHS family L-fucose permease-like MFS transporter